MVAVCCVGCSIYKHTGRYTDHSYCILEEVGSPERYPRAKHNITQLKVSQHSSCIYQPKMGLCILHALSLLCLLWSVYGGHAGGGDATLHEIWNHDLCSYSSMFSNLFYKEADILSMQTEMPPAATIISSKHWYSINDQRSLPSRQLRDYLNRISGYRRTARSVSSYCCETTWNAESPLQVDYEGQLYDVFAPTDGYQLVFTGNCAVGETCGSGTCTVEDDYFTWILIIDLGITDYYPPLKFVPVKYSNYCFCATAS